MRHSDGYAAFVVGFAIMTDSMIYTLVLPFLPTLFAERLRVPERNVPQWTASAFEAFAITTLLTNAVAGLLSDASASRSQPFLISSLIMVMSTVLFFVGTTPVMIIASRAIQGASTTFTWVTGLAFLVAQVGESNLGMYVGWTTVGVAVGEMVGPLVGGPIYDYLGHWAAFGTVEALLLTDILLRVFAKEKRREVITGSQAEQDSELETFLPDEQADRAGDESTDGVRKDANTQRSVATYLAWNWLGTILTLVIIFLVRGALEVAVPLYLIKQYSWTPTKISLVLLTLTLPAAVNPVIGKFTSRQGPRWWSVGAFAICGIAMISFANLSGRSPTSKIFFVVHLTVVGLALAILVNSNQVAISVASQRFGAAKDKCDSVGAVLSRLSPSVLLSGITTSWAAGILLGPIYSSWITYTEEAGWAIFCWGLGGLCLVAAIGSSFLWREW